MTYPIHSELLTPPLLTRIRFSITSSLSNPFVFGLRNQHVLTFLSHPQMTKASKRPVSLLRRASVAMAICSRSFPVAWYRDDLYHQTMLVNSISVVYLYPAINNTIYRQIYPKEYDRNGRQPNYLKIRQPIWPYILLSLPCDELDIKVQQKHLETIRIRIPTIQIFRFCNISASCILSFIAVPLSCYTVFYDLVLQRQSCCPPYPSRYPVFRHSDT